MNEYLEKITSVFVVAPGLEWTRFAEILLLCAPQGVSSTFSVME